MVTVNRLQGLEDDSNSSSADAEFFLPTSPGGAAAEQDSDDPSRSSDEDEFYSRADRMKDSHVVHRVIEHTPDVSSALRGKSSAHGAMGSLSKRPVKTNGKSSSLAIACFIISEHRFSHHCSGSVSESKRTKKVDSRLLKEQRDIEVGK